MKIYKLVEGEKIPAEMPTGIDYRERMQTYRSEEDSGTIADFIPDGEISYAEHPVRWLNLYFEKNLLAYMAEGV